MFASGLLRVSGMVSQHSQIKVVAMASARIVTPKREGTPDPQHVPDLYEARSEALGHV